MYIWMFGIDNIVYYGRTWAEFKLFLGLLHKYTNKIKKYVFIHNASFEFQFLINEFKIKNVFARKSRHVIRFELPEYNIEIRCSYMMSNCSLAKLSDVYQLPVKKLVGDLDYSKFRHSKTELTDKELAYCEYDCLVVYEYIKKELETYNKMKALPMTNTGHVRGEFKGKIKNSWPYKNKVRRAINTDGHVYQMMLNAFAGGYTHSNWLYSAELIKEKVVSYDFCSSYPFCMVSEMYPSSTFKKVDFIKKYEQLKDIFCYLIRVKFKNISCKYYNTFISESKCHLIRKGRYDNGRIIGAEELEITVTEVDLKIIFDTYNIGSYEFIDVYWANKSYLPKEYINYILDKYKDKTQYKNVEGKEAIYNISKQQFNSLYGMTVTNNIKDNVVYDINTGWYETKLTNDEIVEKLQKEQYKGFLSFSYGLYVTAYARRNLLNCLVQNDDFVLYADTDSLKMREGFNIEVINNYNLKVKEKLQKVSNDLEIPIERFAPKDKNNIEHMLGLFEKDGEYEQFITQGAKKYAYIKKVPLKKVQNKDGTIKQNINIQKIEGDTAYILEITVAGVPKSGAKGLKSLEDFKDNFIFEFKYTNKNMLVYNDIQIPFILEDYTGKKQEVKEKYGCVLIPTTYELGKSEEYAELLTDMSSARAIYQE